MKRIFFYVCFASIILSCNSNEDSQNQDSQESNFYALTVGNSWVYKNYRYNPNSEEYDDIGVIDSISIVALEEIAGNSYFKFRRWTTGNEEGISFCNPNGEHFEWLREFEGKLINPEGKVKFVNNDIAERLLAEYEYGNIYEALREGTEILDVESGTFDCIYSERYLINNSGIQTPGLDRFYYSEGVGLIYETASFISQSIPTIIRRLDSYNVQ
ncbi:hypothetical protein [Winogradskyella sp. 3972H.M.0a.05]|uniref:hypothetical protein n=1 Tax=Winogradskyella sp. 3972H.M.0a.05 TaxID=2950277 RepID=UPI003393FDC9